MGIDSSREKVIVLLGASGGVGHALNLYLSHKINIRIIAAYRSSQKTQTSHQEWVHYDSTDLNSADSLIKGLSKKYDIQMIIDVTGAFFASTMNKTRSENIAEVVSTNLTGPLLVCRAGLKYLQQGSGIVFMSSIIAGRSEYGSSVYAASKVGLEKAIEILAPEFERERLFVCGIRLTYMNYGMTFKISEVRREGIRVQLPNSQFTSIDVLGDLIQKIYEHRENSVNGTIFELDYAF